MNTRRQWLAAAALALGLPPLRVFAAPAGLVFPRDFGAHLESRTEWWYITGHAVQGARRFGFQITFFKSRVPGAQSLESRLAARQLLFAHAAITDIGGARLLHDQRMARWSGLPQAQDGFGQGFASLADTDLRIGTGDSAWTLRRQGAQLHARAVSEHFAFDLDLSATQPVLLQGAGGISQKGPLPEQNSHYYSLPQLQVRGQLQVDRQRFALDAAGPADNAAWLDHEWSAEIMPPGAVGWDWTGINGFDGAALTLFRLRRADGGALWAGGSWRASAQAPVQNLAPEGIRFEALRHWTSPRTGVRYPVEWRLDTPVGRFSLHALLDDQELDSRASTGAVYWEGISELRDAQGKAVGRGYLELTGYQAPLRM
ncbi:lipocalin-like domain-containing protein [Xylophilus rhododendri]|uniref:lipocalin-like domain-containing protein n=1 Tax=Xylophilus rhododendri TaxID=2697032 RepID=UPI001E624E0B|nr:lipocalin-like domain-containing protein [Xylophilus rhododendri]